MCSRGISCNPRLHASIADATSRKNGHDTSVFRDDGVVVQDLTEPEPWIPRIPASAGALIFDGVGRLLLLKPTYKKRWTIPGGQIEANGESPWEACQRETREECGLDIVRGDLVCVDFLRPRPKRAGGMRFLFDCGTFTDQQLATITLQEEEVSEHRLEEPKQAITFLSGPVGRRVSAAMGAGAFVYLEDGQPISAVTGA